MSRLATAVRRARLALCLCLPCACSSAPEPATQLLVSVYAEPRAAAQLQRVEVSSYAPDTRDRDLPFARRSFALSAAGAADTQVTFPFSFGVQRGRSDTLLLVFEGYSAGAVEPSLERKLAVHFVARETTPLDVLLADVCYASSCAGLDRTCYPYASASVSAGSCGPVGAASPTTTSPDLDGGAMDAGRLSDAGDGAPEGEPREAGPDATAPSDPAPNEAGMDAAPPPVASACRGENLCLSSEYPCVPSTSTGYSCQGQFAEWPMPDRAPGSKFAPSYDITSVPGVVLDRVTGLIWQQKLPATYEGCTGTIDTLGDSCSWQEAKAYCEQLTLDGKRWRLPSMIELISIVDETVAVPAIDRDAFPNTPRGLTLWSASSSTFTEGDAWAVDFAGGNSGVTPISSPLSARCVRSVVSRAGTPRDHYRVDPANDAIADTRTELVWQRTLNPQPLSWAQAASYCAGLGNGFRLPALKELLTLVDPTRGNAPLDATLPSVPEGSLFWSASPNLLEVDDYWLVALGAGGYPLFQQALDALVDLPGAPQLATYAWCVR